MGNRKSNKLSKIALSKSYTLQTLIDKLNNTTIGGIVSDVEANSYDISTLQTRVDNNDDDIALINAKIDAIASLFNIVFNEDGTIKSEDYSTHTH